MIATPDVPPETKLVGNCTKLNNKAEQKHTKRQNNITQYQVFAINLFCNTNTIHTTLLRILHKHPLQQRKHRDLSYEFLPSSGNIQKLEQHTSILFDVLL